MERDGKYKSTIAKRIVREIIRYSKSDVKKSKIAKDYNGWSNHSTWAFMLWNSDYLAESIREDIQNGAFNSQDDVINAIDTMVSGMIDDLYDEASNLNGVLGDIASVGIGEIYSAECINAVWDDVESNWNEWQSEQESDDDYEASTKKSRMARLNKKLNKLGGFTKEDDDDDAEVEIEVDVDDDDGDADVEVETDDKDDADKGCKSRKTTKGMKRMKMKKGEDMPNDADDFKEDNQKGTGNAGKELPEDADEQQEINEKGSGNAGKELPEDADEQQNIKESARKIRRSTKKFIPPVRNVRKFSVTNGGSPDQTSYNQRYQQSPMTRQAIDRHFGSKADKSFDEVQMLQDRLDALNKSKKNAKNNRVPQKLR